MSEQVPFVLHMKTFPIILCNNEHMTLERLSGCNTCCQTISFTPTAILLDSVCLFGGAGLSLVVVNFTEKKLFL